VKKGTRYLSGGLNTRWYVYILGCQDGSYYTGCAKDLARRIKTHQQGRGARYTRTRLPVGLLYAEIQPSQGAALVREAQLKTWPRKRKTALIRARPPGTCGGVKGRRQSRG